MIHLHPFAVMEKTLWLVIIIALLNFNFAQTNPAVSRAGNYAVPRGSTVRMSCAPPEVVGSEGSSAVWTDEEGREVAGGRGARAMAGGQLQILEAREEDSGTYHCKFRPGEGAQARIFVHKLIVYELSGHKMVTAVSFDVTKGGSESTVTALRQMIASKVCARNECLPGPVTSDKCEIDESERSICEMSMSMEAVEQPQTEGCGEGCVRRGMTERLKQAERVLESTLVSLSLDPRSPVRPQMQTFDTRHVITCKAGYHLIEANYEHCFPCLPGTSSEPEALKCELCPIGFYQERYGTRDCEQCPDDKTTETAGSKSRDDCRPITDTGILKDIKEGISSLFKG